MEEYSPMSPGAWPEVSRPSVTGHQPPGPPGSDICYNGGQCAAPASCAPHYLTSLLEPTALCYLSPNNPGVCCPPHIPSCEWEIGTICNGSFMRKQSLPLTLELVSFLEIIKRTFSWSSTSSKQQVHNGSSTQQYRVHCHIFVHYEFSSRDKFIVTDRDSGVKD